MFKIKIFNLTANEHPPFIYWCVDSFIVKLLHYFSYNESIVYIRRSIMMDIYELMFLPLHTFYKADFSCLLLVGYENLLVVPCLL